MNVIIEDFFCGFAVAQVTIFVLGLWSIPIGIVSGICWLAGGRGWLSTKAWRRIGCPLVICVPFALHGHMRGAIISLIAQLIWHGQGYGVPDVNDATGSWMGRLFGKWTRVVWFGLLGVAMVPLFIHG